MASESEPIRAQGIIVNYTMLSKYVTVRVCPPPPQKKELSIFCGRFQLNSHFTRACWIWDDYSQLGAIVIICLTNVRTSSERKNIAWERGWIICWRERLAGASITQRTWQGKMNCGKFKQAMQHEMRFMKYNNLIMGFFRENKTIYSNGT